MTGGRPPAPDAGGGSAAGSGEGNGRDGCGGVLVVGVVHVLAGYLHRAGWSRAVCRCGHPGPARSGRERAANALGRMHCLDVLQCAWCERMRAAEFPPRLPAQVGLAVHPVGTGPWPDVEHLACAEDLTTCARLAAELTAGYQASAAAADAYCRALAGRQPAGPVLRLPTDN